jgi:hypothetical protein
VCLRRIRVESVTKVPDMVHISCVRPFVFWNAAVTVNPASQTRTAEAVKAAVLALVR